MDNYYYSAKSHAVLTQAFGPLIDATSLVNWQRAVKSPAELAMMRKAGQLTAHMHATLRAGFRAGRRKNELVAEVQAAGIAGIEAFAAHITWNDRPLRSGEATYFEISGCFHRYHCPASRTLYMGAPQQISAAPKRLCCGNRGCFWSGQTRSHL
ncbi:M24 family metallopeptidase [Shimia sp. R10_1]|uniref:M24 family metallopeptidase n=1 Tax=Shimia sp. R10_1 TaxID=2821095 RepID=UPI0032AF8E71